MRGTSQASRSLILFALLHGLLYCSLLPLWEGYDEPFHYGYVKYLVSERRFPVADRSVLDEEIWRSMHLAPTSYMNARNSPGLMPYIDYFALEETARREMRGRLFSLPTDFSAAKTGPNNYEAQQPPLAYLSLAAVEWATRGVALPWRVYILRLLGTFASLAILIYATTRLGQAMGIESAYLGAAIFMLLATQGLYGAVAHIANDWLAVALFPVLFLAAERFRQKPDYRQAALFALALAAGLLTKAYFMVFIPLALLLVVWAGRKQIWLFGGLLAALAGPWYVRNIVLYGSLSGFQASVRAVPRAAILEQFRSTNWLAALLGMARAILWNANSSFTMFSQLTLNMLLLLLAAGAILWLRSRPRPAGWLVAGGSVAFVPVLVYAMALFGAGFKAVYPNASSWYGAGLLPGAFLIAACGFQRGGRWLARLALGVSVYILAVTYFAKLIPLYAGFDGRATIGRLTSLYFGRHDLLARLSDTSTLSGGAVVGLALATTIWGAVVAFRLCRALASSAEPACGPPPPRPLG